jgi:hypothetical protein
MDLTALPDEVWTWLLKGAERFATKKIARYRWRGGKGGGLPGVSRTASNVSGVVRRPSCAKTPPRESKIQQEISPPKSLICNSLQKQLKKSERQTAKNGFPTPSTIRGTSISRAGRQAYRDQQQQTYRTYVHRGQTRQIH